MQEFEMLEISVPVAFQSQEPLWCRLCRCKAQQKAENRRALNILPALTGLGLCLLPKYNNTLLCSSIFRSIFLKNNITKKKDYVL